VHDVICGFRLHAEHPVAAARIVNRAYVLQPFQLLLPRHRHHGLRASLLVRSLAGLAEHGDGPVGRFHDRD
jgi:hypothetical protein